MAGIKPTPPAGTLAATTGADCGFSILLIKD